MTDISRVGTVAEETRVRVLSTAGNDDLENFLVAIQEIWKLNPDGSATLLDRIRFGHDDSQGTHLGFRGLRTRQEAPEKIWAVTFDPSAPPWTINENAPPVPTEW